MPELTSTEYERLFRFSNAINKSYEDFEYATLDALAECLDIHFTSYNIHNTDSDEHFGLYLNISRSIEQIILDEYQKEIYKKDMFVNFFNEYRYSVYTKDIYTSNDFPGDTFQASEHGRFLAKYNIGHQAVLGMRNRTIQPSHTISIFKTFEDGRFTEHELALYAHISKAFNIAVNHYKQYIRQQQVIEATGFFAGHNNIGYALLEPGGTILYNNEAFLNFSAQISEEQDLAATVKTLVDKTWQAGADARGDGKTKTMDMDGFCVAVSRKKFTTPFGVNRYVMLALRENVQGQGQAQSALDSRTDFMEEFNLTPREAEIMMHMAKGLDNNEISNALFISMSTVKSHIRNIYSKLDVSGRTELLRKIKKHIPRLPDSQKQK